MKTIKKFLEIEPNAETQGHINEAIAALMYKPDAASKALAKIEKAVNKKVKKAEIEKALLKTFKIKKP